MRDADSVLAHRVALILDEDDPVLEFQAVFAWTDSRSEGPGSARAVLDSYLESRAASVRRLRPLHAREWLRTGRHEEFGTVTLCEQASYFAAHELIHLRQLERIRRALESEGGEVG